MIEHISLAKKTIRTDWLELNENQSIKIDYPTGLQELSLNDTLHEDGSDMTKVIKYARLLLKYSIKDWKGFDADFKLVRTKSGTEMDTDLWSQLVSKDAITLYIADLIKNELSFDESDKKK